MSSLEDVWPLFALELRTPRLTLRPLRDDDLPDYVEAVRAGIHDPAVMPFSTPWTDELAAADSPAAALQHVWSGRAAVRRGAWSVVFGVRDADGRLLGVQDVQATSFGVTRTVSSGSWLSLPHQGRGVGREMRTAVLHLAFDHLGADRAESAASVVNAASLGVSRSLGYREDGLQRVESRPGELLELQRLRLDAADLVRPDWDTEVRGLDAVRDLLTA